MNQQAHDYQRIATAIEYLSTRFKEQPSLEEVADKIHLSSFHFQRMFTAWAGVSPKKFLQFLTIEYAKDILKNTQSLNEVAASAGLSSSSRLHDLFVSIEGMTPGEYKNNGENLKIQYTTRVSQFGKYLVASTSRGICNLYFYDGEENDVLDIVKNHWSKGSITEGSDVNQERVARFFNHDFNASEKIKLHLKGSDFQIKVWQALLRIPEGNLSSYGKIAMDLQQPNASRAVGTAIGSNQVGFIIPCHRVIKSMGEIGEFRWGSTRKKAMIGWEACKSIQQIPE